MPNDALHGLLDEIDSQPVAPRKSALTSVLDEVDSSSNTADGGYRRIGTSRDQSLSFQEEDAAREKAYRDGLIASVKRSPRVVGNALVSGTAKLGADIHQIANFLSPYDEKIDSYINPWHDPAAYERGRAETEAARQQAEDVAATYGLDTVVPQDQQTIIDKSVFSVGSSAPSMLATLPVGGAVPGKNLIAKEVVQAMAQDAISQPNNYKKAIDAGQSPDSALQDALLSPVIEGAGTLVGGKVGSALAGKLTGVKSLGLGDIYGMGAKQLEDATRRTMLDVAMRTGKNGLAGAISESAGESITEVGHSAYGLMKKDPSLTWDQAVENVMIAGLSGGIMGGPMAAAGGYQRAAPPAAEPAPAPEQVTTTPPSGLRLTPQEQADFERVLSGVTAQPDEVITPVSGAGALTPYTGYQPPVALTPEEIRTLQYRDTMPPELSTLDNTDESMPEIDPLWNYSPEELRDWGRSHVDEGDTQIAPPVSDIAPEMGATTQPGDARIRQPNIRPDPITASGADTQIRAPITITPKFDESTTTQNDVRLPKQDIAPQMEQTSTRLDIPIFTPGEVVTTPADGHGEIVKSLKSGKVLVDVGDKIVSMNANEVSRANEQGNQPANESGRGRPVRDTGITAPSGQAPVQQRAQAVPPAPAAVTAAPVAGNDAAAPKVTEPQGQGQAKANAYIDSLKLSPEEDAIARKALVGWDSSLDPLGYKQNVDGNLRISRELAAFKAAKAAGKFSKRPVVEKKAPVAESKAAPDAQQAAPSEPPKEPAPEPKGRPDLANPAKSEKAREFVGAVDEQNKDQPTAGMSRSELRENARKRISTDRDKVKQEIDELVMTGDAPTREQAEAWRQLIDEEAAAASKPDATLEQKARAALLLTAYRQSGSEAARLLGDRADTEMTPAERLANVRESLLELPQNLRAEVDRLTKQMKKRRKQEQEKADSKAAPATSNAKQKVKGARRAVDDAFKKLAADFKKSLKGGSLGALGGEQFDILTKMLANRVAAGVLKFSDVVLDVVDQVREFRKNPEVHEALEKAWNSLADKDPQLERAKVGDAERAVADQLAQQRLERDAERLASGKEEPERKRIREIHEGWAKRQEKLKSALKELGYDVEVNDPEWAKDPAKAARVLRYVAAEKKDIWDKFYEYRMASMLSGPLTQMVNITSNAAHGLWDFTFQKSLESTLNIFRKDGQSFTEMFHAWSALAPGLKRGFVNAWATFREETPVFERQVLGPEYKGRTSFDDKPGAIRGRTGRVIRLPLTALSVADDFFKSLFGTMEAAGRAYRIAKGEGLTGDALNKRSAELTADMRSQAWHEGLGKAEDLLFQGSDGATAALEAGINHFRNMDPYKYDRGMQRAGARTVKEVTRHTIPFLRTVLNIFGTGIRKSPLGSIPLMTRLATNGFGKLRHGPAGWTYDADLVLRDLAEQVIAWSAMGALFATLDADDDEPWITGSMGGYQAAKTATQNRTKVQPYTVKIGDERWSYAKIEPFATALGLAVDAVVAIKKDRRGSTKSNMVDEGMQAVLGQVREKTFTKSLGDMLKAANGDESASEGYAASLITSFIPNVIRQPSKATDQYERDSRALSDVVWSERMIRSTGVPFIPPPPPRKDLWGRVMKKDSGGTDASDFLYRLFSPVKGEDVNILPVDRFIVNYNNQNPSTPWWPATPDAEVTIDKVKHKLSEADYQELLDSGAEALKKIEGMKFDPEKPTEEVKDKIESAIRKARAAARERIVKRIEQKR